MCRRVPVYKCTQRTKISPPAASGGISREQKYGSRHFTPLSRTIGLINLPQMTSLAASDRLLNAIKYCTSYLAAIQLATPEAFITQYQNVWCPMSFASVNDRLYLDLLTLRIEKNDKITQIGISRLIFEIFMCGLNY